MNQITPAIIKLLRGNNYVRKASRNNFYWFDFSKQKLDQYIANNKTFNLIIYSELYNNDYYIIPYKILKDALNNNSFPKSDVIKERWVGNIRNHILKISNFPQAIDISKYYSIPFFQESNDLLKTTKNNTNNEGKSTSRLGDYISKLLKLEVKHSLYREDGKWYHNLKRFPGALFDKNGYVVFNTQEEYLGHSKLQHRKDLHVIDGIESFIHYKKYNDFERVLIFGIEFLPQKDISRSEETIRILREIDIILRNKSLVDNLKKIYNNSCQICGERIKVGENRFYSEVHHIIPLGRPYNGIDNLDNMICVCPNHHVQLDMRAIPLDLSKLKFVKHKISELYITQYNKMISNI